MFRYIKFLKNNRLKRVVKAQRLLLLSFLFFFLFSTWVRVFATPLYNPGDTLDPSCTPGSTDCTVQIIPDQTGNSGKYLTTNGTSVSWGTVVSGVTSVNSATGAVTLTVSNTGSSLAWSGAQLQIPTATSLISGLLSSTDWSTFNGKQDALGYTPLNAASNLSDLGSASTARTNLGLGTLATLSSINNSNWSGTVLSVSNGGTGTSTTFTQGSLIFAGASGVYTEDNSNLYWDDTNDRLAIGTNSFDGTNPEKLLVAAGTTSSATVIKGTGSINSYLQLNIQNTSSGTSASSDVVATADNGTETTGYVNMGINSSGYTGGVFGSANDAYLYNIGTATGGNLLIGAGSSGKSLYFLTGGTSQASNTRMQISGDGDITFTPSIRTTGSPVGLTFTGPAHTTLTASVEAIDVNLNLARTVQFATGALTTQRAFVVQAPTYAFAGASTITDAATLAVSGAPVKGTNATITSSHGILVQAGAVSTATAAYGLTVNAPTGATTNIAAQFLDAATMSGAETFYPAIDTLRTGGNEGVKIGYWSRIGSAAEGGAVMSRGSGPLILGASSSGVAQRVLSIAYGANGPSMFFGNVTSANAPYDFAMHGAISFYAVPNTTKWSGLVTSGIYTSLSGPIVYGSTGINGATFGDLVLSSRATATAQVGIVTGSTPAVRMRIDSTGGVSVAGLISCAGIQTNASGLMSCTSDETLKDVQGDFTRGLDAIRGLVPKTYSWKNDSYLNDGGVLYSGVLAQNVEQFIPEAVNTGAMGYKQISQMALLVTTINAVKELDLKITPLTDLSTDTPQSLGSLMKQFLSDAGNTLEEVFFGKVHTKELCLDDVCITKSQLQQLLQQQNIQQQPSGGGVSQDQGSGDNNQNIQQQPSGGGNGGGVSQDQGSDDNNQNIADDSGNGDSSSTTNGDQSGIDNGTDQSVSGPTDTGAGEGSVQSGDVTN